MPSIFVRHLLEPSGCTQTVHPANEKVRIVKRKIYFIAPFPPPVTGAATMAEELSETLTQSGSANIDRLNVSMTKLSGSLALYALKSLRLLRAVVRVLCGAYHYLIVVPPGGPMLALYIPILAAARLRGVKILFDHHNYSYINVPTKMMASAAWLMGSQGIHLFLSKKMGQQFSNIYYTNNWRASSNWGRLSFAAREARVTSEQPLTLGFFSNVSLEKGIDTFLMLLEEAVDRGTPVRAVVAGGMDGDACKLVESAIERGLPVEALGPLYGAAKAEFFECCDILALPTRYKNEAEPLVLIEGQIAGCLVIATDVGTIAETIVPECGFTWPCATFSENAADLIDKLANRVENLRRDRKRLAQISSQRASDERAAWKQRIAELIT